MRLSRISVANFRSLRQVEIDLSSFVCIVGHNNSGKSSLLVALSLFESGSSLKPTDFYDAAQEISIEVAIDGVDDETLERLGVHAERISPLVVGGTITLVRRYGVDGKGKLNCRRLVPREPRYEPEHVAELLKGKTGAALKDAMKTTFPELAQRVAEENPSSQKRCKELIEEFVKTLGPEELESREVPLPTGIPASVELLLPEVIYIPAVADASDEVKTKEASSFGKIIRVLLELVEGVKELEDVTGKLAELHGLLNRSTDGQGNPVDNRLDDVKLIEERVQACIREQFKDVAVEIEIPPPDLKTIFSGAKIWLDDGVRGEVDSKGDGLKRAVTFSLLRTYVELCRERANRADGATGELPRYLFLFEEPELYLHPGAQRILYEALQEISAVHQVCVCTHSPYFFSPVETGTYVRLKRESDGEGMTRPSTHARHIQMQPGLSAKDTFQIVCFENNNAAFFCDRVVLVEGDCDVIYLKHVAKVLNPEWDFDGRNVAVVKVGGKGSFQRYRKFFIEFEVEVRVVADLDVIVDGFGKLGVGAESSKLRSELLQEIDRQAESDEAAAVTKAQAKDITGKSSFKQRYERCKEIASSLAAGDDVAPAELQEFGKLFDDETNYSRRRALELLPADHALMMKLLAALRAEGVVVLARGAIESYYPDGTEGDDKPSKALDACQKIRSLEDVVKACGGEADDCELKTAIECLFC